MTYDLIIVGAGPAGSTAALYAARAGLKAMLVDQAIFPRDKICGDAIGGKPIGILRELGLDEAARGLPGASIGHVVFGSPDHVEADVDLSQAADPQKLVGLCVRRTDFDAFLFDAAARTTTACRDGFAVDDLLTEGPAVVGVRGRDLRSGRIEEVRGRIVLGADGYRSIVARRLGLYGFDPRHTAVGLRAYWEGVSGLSDRIELHYVDVVRPGYLWIFPIGSGMANVGIGMLAAPMKRRGLNLVDALDGLIADSFVTPRFAGARQVGRTVGWQLPVGSRRRPCAGAGYMLLGDAAGLIDPFTGEGIGNAMVSGRSAVAVAAEAIASGDVGARSLARYEAAVWSELGPELALSTRLQQIARIRPLFEFTVRKAARNPEVSKLIGAMMADTGPRAELTSPLFYLKLLFR